MLDGVRVESGSSGVEATMPSKSIGPRSDFRPITCDGNSWTSAVTRISGTA